MYSSLTKRALDNRINIWDITDYETSQLYTNSAISIFSFISTDICL